MRAPRRHVLLLILLSLAAPALAAAGGPDEAPAREWLAGDLHVHTTYSHDVFGGLHDEDTGLEEAYALGLTPGEMVALAESRGLDYLALTDHNTVAQQSDAGHASARLVLVPGYEASLRGHAQMLGATRVLDRGDASAVAVRALAAEHRAAGGVLQINHPAAGHAHAHAELDWSYGYDVEPDAVEVWNVGPWMWQPPFPSSNDNEEAVRYWQGWLDRGVRVAATGASDHHWASLTAVAGVGQPTTWVHADARTPEGVLRAIREGRTFVSHQPPALGGPRVFLEADADGDGRYEATVGDAVAAGASVRVRVEGATPNAVLRVVTDHGSSELPAADGSLDVTPGAGAVPPATRWVRVEMYAPAAEALRGLCEEPAGEALARLRGDAPGPVAGLVPEGTTYCRNRLAMLAITSAIHYA